MGLERAFCKVCLAEVVLGKALLRDGTVAMPYTWECTLFCSPACIAVGEPPIPPEIAQKLIAEILADEAIENAKFLERQRQPG